MKHKETQPTNSNGNAYPVKLPPSISAILEKHTWPTQAEMLAVRDWFATYFTQTFRTFDRKTVGRRISPADELMQTAFAFLHIIAPCLPKAERERVYIPLNVLLNAIAERWEDTAAPALGALQHVHELENIVMLKTDTVHQWSKSGEVRTNEELRKRAQAVLDEYANERRELKKELGKLSAQLLQANPNELKETLAQMKADICAAVFDTSDKTQHTIAEEAKKIRAKIHAELAGAATASQLRRAADLIISRNEKGEVCSPEDAAIYILAHPTEDEKRGGGYKNPESLRTQLYERAEELKIDEYISGKRGRPRKQQ